MVRTASAVIIGLWLGSQCGATPRPAGKMPALPAIERRLESLTRFTYTEYHMGVDARLVVYAPSEKVAQEACSAAFERIAALDTMLSDYRVDSELNRLCARSGGPPVPVSPELFKVFRRAQEVSRRSRGAFDITVGPLVRLWRAARKMHALPTQAQISNALMRVGWRKIHLDPRTRSVRLDTPGMQLDLGGIAKGYADDEAQMVLRRHGITRALVEMGGDIVVSGPPPDEKGWLIEVPNALVRQRAAGSSQQAMSDRERLRQSVLQQIRATPGALHPVPDSPEVLFSHCAISSSGDTEQFEDFGGKRYSHIVDPRTGWALTSRVQVTVIARNGLTSDPLTKAVTMLTPAARRRFLRAYPGSRCFVRVLKNP